MKTKQTKAQRINAMTAKYPDMKPREIAKRLGIDIGLVYQVRYETKKNSEFVNTVFTKAKKEPSRVIEEVTEMKKVLDELDKIKDKPKKSKAIQEGNDLANKIFQETYDKYHPDLVNHPPHYKSGGIETIDFIEAKDLNYRLGNVVKYVSRAGRKNSDPVEDLQKAAWYLQREIEARKNA
jgi:transposase